MSCAASTRRAVQHVAKRGVCQPPLDNLVALDPRPEGVTGRLAGVTCSGRWRAGSQILTSADVCRGQHERLPLAHYERPTTVECRRAFPKVTTTVAVANALVEGSRTVPRENGVPTWALQ